MNGSPFAFSSITASSSHGEGFSKHGFPVLKRDGTEPVLGDATFFAEIMKNRSQVNPRVMVGLGGDASLQFGQAKRRWPSRIFSRQKSVKNA